MIRDKFLSNYIGSLKQAIEDAKEDLAEAVYTDLYSVGKMQGLIIGLSRALQILEATIEEVDQ